MTDSAVPARPARAKALSNVAAVRKTREVSGAETEGLRIAIALTKQHLVPPMQILVVDDNVDIADSMAEILVDSLPFNVVTDVGYDGAQGLSLALAHRPDVAILDIDMPVMNGINAAFAIRHAFFSNPPLLIAISGKIFRENGVDLSAAFDEIFQKPIDLDRLIKVVGAAHH
jgi:two-component system response regulator DesR